MSLIDVDNLELAAWTIIVDDVNQSIEVVKDKARTPNITANSGYLKVEVRRESDNELISTSIMHWRELEALVNSIEP